MKLVLPMAGYGTRLRPHTWSKPKPLVRVADRTVLDHFLDPFAAMPDVDEVVFIIGYLGEQIREHVAEHYAEMHARYVVQEELSGQSHAIWLAREGLEGSALISFVDTLTDSDYSGLEGDEAVIWTKEVEDPHRFGVVELDGEDRVARIIEKPDEPPSNLAVIGSYYLREVERLVGAIDEQMRAGTQLKGEFFIADAINLLLEGGMNMRAEQVNVWNDCGTLPALLDTNRYLLENGRANSDDASSMEGAVIEPPVYLAPDVTIDKAVIGPYAAIGPGCTLVNATIVDSILEAGASLRDCSLSGSFIGRRASVTGGEGSLNIGDDAVAVGIE